MRKILRRVRESAVVWSFINTLLRVGGSVFVLPLILLTVPPEHLGLWYVFGTLGAFTALLDFGFEPTVTRLAGYLWAGAPRLVPMGIHASDDTSQRGNPNFATLATLVATLRSYYLRSGAVVLALLLFGGGAWIWIKTAGLSGAGSLRTAWVVYAVGCALNFVNGRWLALLTGIGSQRVALQVNTTAYVFYYVVAIGALFAGAGLWALVIATITMGALSRTWGRITFTRLAFPGGLPHAAFSAEVFAAIWPNAWRMGLVSLGGYMIIQANTLICSGYLGLKATASYGLSMQLTMMLVGLSGVWVYVKFPLINQLRVRGEAAEIARVFTSRLRLAVLTYAGGAVVILLFASRAIRMIGSQTDLLPMGSLAALLLVQFLEMHHTLYAVLVMSENKNPFLRPALLSGVAIVLLSSLTTPRWGVWGMIASAGIVQACCNNWWPVVRAIRGLSIPAPTYWRMFFKPTLSL